MEIYDISREFFSAPLYPGTEPPQIIEIERIGKNNAEYNLSGISADLHTATHCDAYSHFISGGTDIANMDLKHYIGECFLLETIKDGVITKEYLEVHLPRDIQRLLLKTGGNSYLDNDAAQLIKSRGVITIGTDSRSISPPDNEIYIHRLLLGNSIAIIEQLDLEKPEQGFYTLFAPPVKISGAEGAPCRAILIRA